MRDTVALHRYLQRHAEPGIPPHRFSRPHWHQVLVVPAYRESPSLLEQLTRLPSSEGTTLVILVLNRPDSDTDTLANAALRDAIAQSALPQAMRDSVRVRCLNPKADLHLYDLEMQRGPTPQSQGVGLARKAGCDLALQWWAEGAISGQWLCSTDADATLPQTYFAQLAQAPPDAVAAVFPFRHIASGDAACDTATALYELRLHAYVLGLEYAGSPYAFHTLGSSLAIRCGAYAHAHGFPKRAGAEDFYLLNKLAKLGPVARLRGRCIELQSRVSARVPFGTGPAVAALTAIEQPLGATLFYHPRSFAALAAFLATLPALADRPGQDLTELLSEKGYWGLSMPKEARGQHSGLTLRLQDCPAASATKAANALESLGIASALDHCQRHANSREHYVRHFHQWFDGFRTLKFIHALRDDGLPLCSLDQLNQLTPHFWPAASAEDNSSQRNERMASGPRPSSVGGLLQAVRQHWQWY